MNLSEKTVLEIADLAEACNPRRSGPPVAVPIFSKDVLTRLRDPKRAAWRQSVEALSKNELCELTALMWIGRGDANEKAGDFERLVRKARSKQGEGAVSYVMKAPLGTYLRRGLAKMGLGDCS